LENESLNIAALWCGITVVTFSWRRDFAEHNISALPYVRFQGADSTDQRNTF
jgi:hypothetical protein